MNHTRRTIPLVAAAILLAVVGGWLVFSTPSPDSAARHALESLAGAVERRDEAAFADLIHPSYYGWGGNRHDVLSIFGRFNQYQRRPLSIELRDFEMNETQDDDEAVIRFSWRYSQWRGRESAWSPAEAILSIDQEDGRWKLLEIEAELPEILRRGDR